jgi:hypothetical protein
MRIARESLLLALMQSKPVFDSELERLLTALRRDLLHVATKDASKRLDVDELEFYCAMAQQCFINEYVYALDDSGVVPPGALLAVLSQFLVAQPPVLPKLPASKQRDDCAENEMPVPERASFCVTKDEWRRDQP